VLADNTSDSPAMIDLQKILFDLEDTERGECSPDANVIQAALRLVGDRIAEQDISKSVQRDFDIIQHRMQANAELASFLAIVRTDLRGIKP
jgi:hypothetical protein